MFTLTHSHSIRPCKRKMRETEPTEKERKKFYEWDAYLSLAENDDLAYIVSNTTGKIRAVCDSLSRDMIIIQSA